MSSTILHKRNFTKGLIPTTSSLSYGELGINVADGKIFLKKSGSNGESIQSAVTTDSITYGTVTISGSLVLSGSKALDASVDTISFDFDTLQFSGSFGLTGSLTSNSTIKATSFTGSFQGNGSGITNIPASSIIGLNLSRITSGSVSASISPNRGLLVNTRVVANSFTGSFSGNGGGITNIPAGSIVGLNLSRIAVSGVTASVSTGAASFNIVRNNSSLLYVSSSGRIGLGTTTPTARLHITGSSNSGLFEIDSPLRNNIIFVSGSGRIGLGTNLPTSTLHITGSSNLSLFRIDASRNPNIMFVTGSGRVGINTNTPSSSLSVRGTTTLTGRFNTAISGSVLTVVGSGSAQAIFRVQGSQGELFSVTDSLTGSLFSVNDISGLPVLETFSNGQTLLGDYLAPVLITSKRITSVTGSNLIYSVPTSSYNSMFVDYVATSASNARAGTITAVRLGTQVKFTETTTTDFGSTTDVKLGVFVSGRNMNLTGSISKANWVIKTIVKAI